MKKIIAPLFIAAICFCKTSSYAQVNIQDSLALVNLYDSTNGPHWFNNKNWLTTNPLKSWYGIMVKYGRVTEIHLYGNLLTKTIPSSIGNLSKLEYLDLGYNSFSDSLPASFANLSKLTFLGLSRCNFTGSIPPVLSALSNLDSLDLSFNTFNVLCY